eukprot:1161605-Pelagomonas_calceolata.AAC.1
MAIFLSNCTRSATLGWTNKRNQSACTTNGNFPEQLDVQRNTGLDQQMQSECMHNKWQFS